MNKKTSGIKHDLGTLLICIITVEGLAFIVSMFNKGSSKYYELLRKPIFALPASILAISWPIVLLLISIAAYFFIIKIREDTNKGRGILCYVVQVSLNFMWPFIFFRLNLYGISFILSLVLILVTVFTAIEFFRRYKISAIIMIPYMILVIYSSILNYYIWILNEA